MSSLPFSLPSPLGSGFSFVPSPGGTPLSLLDATPLGPLGQSDQLIDPTTGDYVDTDNGEWAETADSRPTMLIMLEMELGASPYDPRDGTTLRARMRDGDPVTPEEIESETRRAGGILQAASIIADFTVSIRDPRGQLLRDQSGRLLVQTSWRDLASGSPIDLLLQPG